MANDPVLGLPSESITAPDSFLAFTDDGRFLDVRSPSVTEDGRRAMTNGLYSYITSESLAQNGWYALLLPGLNPEALFQNATAGCPAWAGKNCNEHSKDLGCKGTLDSSGMCGVFWYSREQRSSYTLLHRGSSMGKDKVLDIMHKLIGYQLANLPIMFEQATACEFLHLFPQTAHASYGISQDEGGIFFVPNEDTQNSLTQLVGGNNELVSIDASNGTVFYKIGDSTYGGWSLLSMNHTQHPRLVYPVDTSIYLDWDGLENLQCTSQLDANVANSWGGDKRNDWRLFDSRD